VMLRMNQNEGGKGVEYSKLITALRSRKASGYLIDETPNIDEFPTMSHDERMKSARL
jgi:hypothetical protein